MLSVNGRNCYVTRKIGIGLKMVEKCSIDRTRLIEYNWVQSRVRIHGLMNNEDRCSGKTLRVKRRGQLIVRLKAIKFREDTFRYLSFYLHHSFL